MTSIFSFIKRVHEPAIDPAVAKLARVKALKEEALANAAADAAHEGRKPTLTDYFIACEVLGEKNASELRAENIAWDRKIYTDLSGLTVQGYLIRQEDIAPPADVRQRAMERAQNVAAHQQRQPTVLDFLRSIKHELDLLLPAKKAG